MAKHSDWHLGANAICAKMLFCLDHPCQNIPFLFAVAIATIELPPPRIKLQNVFYCSQSLMDEFTCIVQEFVYLKQVFFMNYQFMTDIRGV